MRRLTIVGYHYVRDLNATRFPRIKGLTVTAFREQLAYLAAHHTFVSIDDVLGATAHPGSGGTLPPAAVLLTFDDGYADHFDNVFPILLENGIRGCFYPAAQPLVEQRVLEVNKIQFVLAAASDLRRLLQEILALARELGGNDLRIDEEELYGSSADVPRCFDVPEVAVIKRLLQRELPEHVRSTACERLFAKYVTSDERGFASELYMSPDELAFMSAEGMHIGSHGYAHLWLDRATPDVQAADIDRSLAFLRAVGCGPEWWSFCYPYGGCSASVAAVLRSRGCRLGLTVRASVADLDLDDPLMLPRLDTNDLPRMSSPVA